MAQPKTPLAFVLVLLTLATSAFAQCPGDGSLFLELNGNRLGDPFSIVMNGSSSVSGLLGFDSAGGPVPTPVGTICLGFTPDFQLFQFTLDAGGNFATGGIIPPVAVLNGFTVHMQALAVDPSQPNGFALSNGVANTLRPPRIYFYEPGLVPPIGTPTPGSFCIFDALSDVPTTPAIPFTTTIQDAVAVPALGWVVFLLGNATVVAYDSATGAPVLTLPIPTSPGNPRKLAVDGTTLHVLCPGTPPGIFSSGTPGSVRSYTFPDSGGPATPGPVTPLVAGYHDAILAVPGTNLVYVRNGSEVLPIAAGSALPPIQLGGAAGPITEWVLNGSTIYCLMPGMNAGPFGGGAQPGLNAVDTFTQTALFPGPVGQAVLPPLTTLRIGPGSNAPAPSVFAYSYLNGTILELSPATFLPLSSISAGPGIIAMELSPGGSEWLLLCNGFGCGGVAALEIMLPSFLVPTLVATLPPGMQAHLIPVPSATLRKAYLVAGLDFVAPFTTDPAAAPYLLAQLPVSSGLFKVLVD